MGSRNCMEEIVAAIETNQASKTFAALEVPSTYRGLVTRKADVQPTLAIPVHARDPRRTLHVQDVPVPELAPDECLIAVMASSLNFNTVWSALFEPVPTFSLLERVARRGGHASRHAQDFHVLGSDAAGVVLRAGVGVTNWKPGDRVVIHGAYANLENPDAHDDAMMDPSVVAWGYETNFGGLGEFAVAKATQLLPKPEQLTWEEAAVNGVANSTAYRQLISQNGGGMRQGDVVLIWGASSGIGSYAVQYALNGGAYPIAVVSSEARAALVRRMGCEWVINRKAEDYRFFKGDAIDQSELRRFRARIHQLTGGEDPRIVFEHVGRETFAASVYVAAKGGLVTTCASTTGFLHTFDNRFLWGSLKKIVGTHIANLSEAALANRLVAKGAIYPTLSSTVALDDARDAVGGIRDNTQLGKVGVLCLAPQTGLGVRDTEARQKQLHNIELFPRFVAEHTASHGSDAEPPRPVPEAPTARA
jgi:crotonyl-CoA reductase